MALVWLAAAVLLGARGGQSLRNVSMTVEPSAVEQGLKARLHCHYDLEGAPLYSVKWYRGTREFYRFTPTDKLPQTKVFHIPGINVDLSHSNATQVTLTDVGFPLAGNVSCEVTTDGPKFGMLTANAVITVVALPKQPPKVWPQGRRYLPGDILQANCTSSASKPTSELSFKLNNRTLPSVETRLHQEGEAGDQWTSASVTLPLHQHHFAAGRLSLQCVATMPGGLVFKSELHELGDKPSEPIPERVTSSSSGEQIQALPSLRWMLVLVLISTLR